MFQHNKPIYQDKNPNLNFNYNINEDQKHKSKHLKEAIDKDNNFIARCYSERNYSDSSYKSFLKDMEKLKSGKSPYECSFINFEQEEIETLNPTATYVHNIEKGIRISFDVTGDRNDVELFFINEIGYTRKDFSNEHPSQLEIAQEVIKDKITFSCHKKSIDFFKNKLKESKDLTDDVVLSYEFIEGFHIDSFAVKHLFFNNRIKVVVEGSRCEVNLVINKLKSYKNLFSKDQTTIKSKRLLNKKEYIN
jgi:rubrerythrin